MLLAPAFAAGYMAWVTWTAQADSKWLFTVLAVFFLGLIAAVLWPRRVTAAEAAAPAGTRFASQRGLLLAMVVLAVLVLAIAVGLLRRLFS